MCATARLLFQYGVGLGYYSNMALGSSALIRADLLRSVYTQRGLECPFYNALRMNYIINCPSSRDLLVVSGVHGVRLGEPTISLVFVVKIMRFFPGLCKLKTGWRMADGGWRITKCGWKNAEVKMQMTKCEFCNQLVNISRITGTLNDLCSYIVLPQIHLELLSVAFLLYVCSFFIWLRTSFKLTTSLSFPTARSDSL